MDVLNQLMCCWVIDALRCVRCVARAQVCVALRALRCVRNIISTLFFIPSKVTSSKTLMILYKKKRNTTSSLFCYFEI